MTIEGGGQVIAARDGYVAANLGTTGTVLVSGTDAAGNASTWSMEDNLRVGSQGDGTLTIAAGGLVTAGGSVTITGRTFGSGAITVSVAAGAASASALDPRDEPHIASHGTIRRAPSSA